MSKANGDISRLLIAAAGEAWALHEPTLQALQSLLVRHATGDAQISEAELASIAAAESRGGPKSPAISGAVTGAEVGGSSDGRRGWSLVGSVAHIPVGGVIARYANQVNGNSQPRGTSVESLRTTIAQVRMDPKVRSALLHVDSPGGSVSGLATLAEDLRGLRSHLEAAGGSLWSFADGLMASAAYWISAQAGRLLAEPAASVGSIGVYSLVVDDAKWYADRGLKVHMLKAGKDKGIGAPGQSITPEQLTVLQSQVDEFYAMFRGEVKRGRGMSEEAVDRAATGRVWIAEQAKAMGLVDEISPNVEAVVSRMEELFGAKAKGGGSGGVGGSGGTRMSMDAGVLPALADGAGGGGKDAGAAAPQEDPMKARELMEAAGGVNGGGGGGGGAVTAAGVGGGAPVAGAPVVGLQGQALSEAIREIQMAAAPFAHIPKVRELCDAAVAGLSIGTHSVAKFRADAMQAVADASSKPMNSVAGGGRGEGVGGLPVTVGSDGRERYRTDITLALLGKADPSLEGRLGTEPDREKGHAGGEVIAEALGFAKAGEARAAIAKARAGFGSMRLNLKAVMATCVGMAAGISPYQAEERAGGDVMKLMQMACNFASPVGGVMAGAGVTTSDFPLILQNVMHKALLAKFAEAMPKWREIAIKGNFSDYRPKYVYAMSETGDYEEIGERETPTNTSTRERRQSMAAKAYARKFSLTEEMVRNDDLGAFAGMPIRMGEAAARVPDKLLAALIALNSGLGPTLEDGVTLIASAHNNVLGNTALSHAALVADIVAFGGSQKGFGEDQALIDVEPAILLVANAHGMTAKEILTSPYKPGGTNQEVNVIRDMVRAVAWRRLTGNRRYLLADPNRLPVFEVGFLDGQETPRVDSIPMVNPREMEWQYTLPGCGVGTTGQYEGIASNQGG